MPGARIFKNLLGAAIFFLGACAQQSVISHVNQQPLFHPSQLGHAARNGSVPLEIYGGPPAGMTAEEITGALHVPGGYAARFALAPAQAANDDLANRLCLQGVLDAINSKITTRCHLPARMVLVFHPHIQTLPDLACEAPEKIVTGGGQEPHVMAAFCLGSRLAASGQVRVPGAAATPAGIVKAINVLLLDMTSRRPDGRGENGRQRG